MRLATLALLIAVAFALTWNAQTCYDGRILVYGYLETNDTPNVYVKLYNSSGELVKEGYAAFYSDYRDNRGVGFFVYEANVDSNGSLVSINTPEGSDLRIVNIPTDPGYRFKIVDMTDDQIALYFNVSDNITANITVDGRFGTTVQTLNLSNSGFQFIPYSHSENEVVVMSDGYCYDYWIFHDPKPYYAIDVSYPELSAKIGDELNFTIELKNEGDPIDLTLASDADLNVTSLHLDSNDVAYVRVVTKYSGEDITIDIDPMGTYVIPVNTISPQLFVEEVVMPTAYKGEKTTGYLTVRNNGNEAAKVRFKYEYDGQIYSDARERTILPGDEAQFYFTIIPNGETITFYIGDITYTYSFPVYEKQRRFEAYLSDIPAVINAGEEDYAILEIKNTGDCYDIYKISVSGVNYAYPQKSAISLEPGEDAKIKIYIKPKEDERVGFKTADIEICGLQDCKDLSVDFYVSQPEERQTIISAPKEIKYHRNFSFVINVTNIGDSTKNYEVSCGELNKTWSFALEPNETKSINISGNGSYKKLTFTFEVNGISITKEVKMTPEKVPTGAFIGGGAAILWVIPIAALIALLAYLYYFRK